MITDGDRERPGRILEQIRPGVHFPQFGVLVTSAPPSGARPRVDRLERDAVASANVRRDDRCRRREPIRQHVKELPELRRPRGTENPRSDPSRDALRQARR